MKFAKIIYLFILFLFSCKDNIIVDPGASPTSGEVTINTEYIDGKIAGFSFSQAKVIAYSISQGIKPDVIVNVHTSEIGNPIGVFLSSVNLKPTFHLKYWPSSMDSAEAYFDALSYIPDTTFQDLAIPIADGQIWAVKTQDDRFAKILIKGSIAYVDSSDTNAIKLYGEVTFNWVFQPDGSRNF